MVEEQARAVIDAPWPEPAQAGVGVFANEQPRVHVEVLRSRPSTVCSAQCSRALR